MTGTTPVLNNLVKVLKPMSLNILNFDITDPSALPAAPASMSAVVL